MNKISYNQIYKTKISDRIDKIKNINKNNKRSTWNPLAQLTAGFTATTEARKFVHIEAANRLSDLFPSKGRIGRSSSSRVDIGGRRGPRAAISPESIPNVRRSQSDILVPKFSGALRSQSLVFKCTKCTYSPILAVLILTGKVGSVFAIRMQDLRRRLSTPIRELRDFTSPIAGLWCKRPLLYRVFVIEILVFANMVKITVRLSSPMENCSPVGRGITLAWISTSVNIDA